MTKYVTAYVKEHYDAIKLKKDVAEKLKELAKSAGLTISDLTSYLLTNMQGIAIDDVADRVASEVAGYVLNNFREERIKLLNYPGGDYRIFDQLNRLFMAAKASTFVEVFGGSCWCALNVSRSKFKVVVCNDIDEDLINLYKLVKERPSELIKRLAILPFSRELHVIASKILRISRREN